ncbi:hypothetical protein EYF80_052143 [Liparis tanakae]|uniref:Uncharacterized protein n=1 Tax=Liparis tanakae TaxID=230148 RepID=A0A4Z2FA88_9TELE|nr:hypothetical protein EYF80_052143 [Liparis tanakae]
MWEQRPRLDPIQEESEREDEFERSDTGEEEEEEENEENEEEEEGNGEVMAEDGSDEESEGCAILRLLRPQRRSQCLSQESSLVQSTENNREEEAELSESDGITRTPGGPGEDCTPPRQTSSGDERRLMKRTLKVYKWKKNTIAKPSAQKKRNSNVKKTKTKTKTKTTRKKISSLTEEPFPRWLVDLMVNIEEATTHQLLVE